MVGKIFCISFLALISIICAAQFPFQHNALKAEASDEDTAWVWSSRQRDGRRLSFQSDGDDDEDDDDDDDEHHEHCHHHGHHHGHYHGHHHSHHDHHQPPIHFGPPRHRHHPYRGSVQNYRHRPVVYPPPLAPFNPAIPEPSVSKAQTTNLSEQEAPIRNPAPVFEAQEEEEESNVPLSPIISSTTTTTTTEKPAYEKIDLRFGA